MSCASEWHHGNGGGYPLEHELTTKHAVSASFLLPRRGDESSGSPRPCPIHAYLTRHLPPPSSDLHVIVQWRSLTRLSFIHFHMPIMRTIRRHGLPAVRGGNGLAVQRKVGAIQCQVRPCHIISCVIACYRRTTNPSISLPLVANVGHRRRCALSDLRHAI